MTDAVRSGARLRALAPQFLMVDLEEAVAFYVEKLGFVVEFTYSDFYVSVERDGLAVHLKLSDDPDPSRAFKRQEEHLDAYITTDDVEALFSEYEERGVTFVQPLQATPWGTREFLVADTGGHLLCFGRPA